MDDIKRTLDDIRIAFEEYKNANDARLDELKKSSGQAGELEEKLSKIEVALQASEDRLSHFEARANRPELGDLTPEAIANKEHKAAFNKFVRKGVTDGLAELQMKAVQVGVDADGGYAVPQEIYREIFTLLGADSPMRAVCDVRLVGTEAITQLVDNGGLTTGWVGETDARPVTATPTLSPVTPTFGEIYCQPSATQKALDDIWFNVEDWLATSAAREFAKQENIAFTAGTGTNQPKGLLTVTTAATADDTRAFGTFEHIATGVAADFPATSAAFGDMLIDVITALKSRYYGRSRWMMNRQTLAAIRKLKDSENNYLWQPGLQSGEPNSILGFPYTYNDDFPSAGANAIPIAFGDFREAYIIMDRTGIRLLRDPYSNKPYVNFYMTKRVGNMILNSEAVKFVKCTA